MNCLIVDDDEICRTQMKHLVSQVHFLNLFQICSTGAEALEVLKNNKIDFLLLDIEMPDITGIELLKLIKNPPLTIFTTSQRDYAVEAFEYNIVDYLIKPVFFDRFFKAIGKVKEMFENSMQSVDFSNNYVFIKNNGVLIKVDTKEILWIEALGDYMTINTYEKKYTIHSTMKMIESKLDPKKFIRVHRSSIVFIDNITSIEDNLIVIGKQLIPVGAVYKDNLMKRLKLL